MATVLLGDPTPGAYPDYASLKAGVLAWAQREDLESFVAAFIELAERTMYREMALRAHETSFSGTTSGSTISLPAVLNAIERVELTANGVAYSLDYSSPNGVEHLTHAGQPTRYTVEKGAIQLIGGPAGPFNYTVYYLPIPSFLSASNQTNALLSAHSDVYLWGALVELSRFTKDKEDEATYLNAYQNAVSSIQRADERRRFPISGGLQIKPRGFR